MLDGAIITTGAQAYGKRMAKSHMFLHACLWEPYVKRSVILYMKHMVQIGMAFGKTHGKKVWEKNHTFETYGESHTFHTWAIWPKTYGLGKMSGLKRMAPKRLASFHTWAIWPETKRYGQNVRIFPQKNVSNEINIRYRCLILEWNDLLQEQTEIDRGKERYR